MVSESHTAEDSWRKHFHLLTFLKEFKIEWIFDKACLKQVWEEFSVRKSNWKSQMIIWILFRNKCGIANMWYSRIASTVM